MKPQVTRLAEEAKLRADTYMAASSFRNGDAMAQVERNKLHAAIDALLALVQPAANSFISHTETVSAPGAAWKVDVIHLTDAGRRALTSGVKSLPAVQPAVSEEARWQPMKTAPRDGERIIIGFADSFSAEAYWMGDAGRNHWKETGWFFSDDDVLTGHPAMPDCWQPLPTPPAACDQSSAKGDES